MTFDNDFWDALDYLKSTSYIVIERKKGGAHPKFPNFIYPVDYGYLANTSSMDGEEIDVYVGQKSNAGGRIDAVLCTIDLLKRDIEIKILIDCSEEELFAIYNFHNSTENMKCLLIRR